MSHYAVTVKLSAERVRHAGGDIDKAVADMLSPFDENTEDEHHLTFEGEEDALRKQYDETSIAMVRTPQGELVWRTDERFLVPGTFGTGGGTHNPPDGWIVQVPLRERYASFESFCSDYAGHSERDQKTARFGHWRNPNGKWDWYSIGGRWSGHFPLHIGKAPVLGRPGASGNQPRPNKSDIARIGDINLASADEECRAEAARFFREYQRLLEGASYPAFEGPRDHAMSIGLIRVEKGPAVGDVAQVVIPWRGQVDDGDARSSWNDVATRITQERFLSEYGDCFHPLNTYAALDDDGWHAPGEMGWFGCSSDEPEAYVSFSKTFVSRFVLSATPSDTLAVVDCHT